MPEQIKERPVAVGTVSYRELLAAAAELKYAIEIQSTGSMVCRVGGRLCDIRESGMFGNACAVVNAAELALDASGDCRGPGAFVDAGAA